MKKKRILVIVMVLFLSACAILAASDQLGLLGTSWKLVSYNGVPPIPGKDMTATFDGEGINGSASCNHYFGTYQIRENQISIEGLTWTEMACLDPEGIMEQEQALMGLLSRADTLTRVNDILEIKTTTGESMIFELSSNGE